VTRFAAGFVALAAALCAPLSAQTGSVERRLARLEQQVREMEALHAGSARAAAPAAGLPAELASNVHLRWGHPGGRCRILEKSFYVICEDVPNRVPEWVTYRLTRQDLGGKAKRKNNFRPDPDLAPNDRAEKADYKGSGYDQGHMAPAADFKRSDAAMSATFFLSNMAPQYPNLNRRIWGQLEDQVRELAKNHGTIWIFTGPLYLDARGDPTTPKTFIGPDRVAVPTHFFKVVVCELGAGKHEMFAFIMPNQREQFTNPPSAYLRSVDVVERLAGLDFFADLPDTEENRLELRPAPAWPVP
jgi:endonuclease G, mitochondrial